LRRGGGVDDHANLLPGEASGVGEEPGRVPIDPKDLVGAGAQGRVEAAEVVEFGHELEARAGHAEVVAERGALLVGTVKHVLPVGRVGPAVEILLGPVVEAGDAARGVEKGQGQLEPGRRAAAGVEKARVVVVVEIEHERVERGGIVVRCRQVVVAVLDLPGVA
jgi:hypothetical protein